MLEVPPKSCSTCGKRLFATVSYCPYCSAVATEVKPRPSVVPPPLQKVAPPASANAATGAAKIPPVVEQASNEASSRRAVPPPAAHPMPPPQKKAATPKTPPIDIEPPPAADAPNPSSGKSGGSSGIWGFLALLLIGIGAGFYWFATPSKKDLACTQAISSATEKLAAGNAAEARKEALRGMASCSGEDRTKVADIQAAAEKLVSVQLACERGYRQISGLIDVRNLQSARSALDKLDPTCSGSTQGTELRQKIVFGQAAAIKAETEVRKQLSQGNPDVAQMALEQVGAENREHPDLATLRQEVQAAITARELSLKPVEVQPTSPIVASPPPPVREIAQPKPAPVPLTAPPATPQRSPQADLVQSFLHDAETAMGQLKFDAAKTYVESARRIDPTNAQATALLRKIKERELEYIRKEMTIN